MKPLFVLIIVFVISLLTGYLIYDAWLFIFSGNVAMCVMLLFTAMGHFKFPKGMAMMMPLFIRNKEAIVLISGLAEIILGILLLFPVTRFYAGVLLVAMFVLMLPANISAARRHVNYEKASYDGPGPSYLYFRIPMQLLLIAWVIYFSIQSSITSY
jgi:uncharacterized membrane protein